MLGKKDICVDPTFAGLFSVILLTTVSTAGVNETSEGTLVATTTIGRVPHMMHEPTTVSPTTRSTSKPTTVSPTTSSTSKPTTVSPTTSSTSKPTAAPAGGLTVASDSAVAFFSRNASIRPPSESSDESGKFSRVSDRIRTVFVGGEGIAEASSLLSFLALSFLPPRGLGLLRRFCHFLGEAGENCGSVASSLPKSRKVTPSPPKSRKVAPAAA